MAAVKTNIWGIKVGDVVKFKSIHDCLVTIEIARVEEKSWYRTDIDMRSSWGTMFEYSKLKEFEIVSK